MSTVETTKSYKSDVPIAPLLFPIGTNVIVPNWPTGGKVIGHHDGLVIVKVHPIAFRISDLAIDKGQ